MNKNTTLQLNSLIIVKLDRILFFGFLSVIYRLSPDEQMALLVAKVTAANCTVLPVNTAGPTLNTCHMAMFGKLF